MIFKVLSNPNHSMILSSEQESPVLDPVLRLGCTRSGWKVPIFVFAGVNPRVVFWG